MNVFRHVYMHIIESYGINTCIWCGNRNFQGSHARHGLMTGIHVRRGELQDL